MASPLLLSGVWTTQRVKGWWVSEKYDGIRTYWSGSAFFSRDGNLFNVPEWVCSMMPKGIAVDGEIWCGRGRYVDALAACKSARHKAWDGATVMALDLPNHSGVFEERQMALRSICQNEVLKYVPHELCSGMNHLKSILRDIHRNRGEGAMLREAGSRYVVGRSNTLLKIRCMNNPELL